MTRYTFNEVQHALKTDLGLTLQRGERVVGERDGRWDVTHSKTGFIVGGSFPGCKHSYRHYPSLTQIVSACDLRKTIEGRRRG